MSNLAKRLAEQRAEEEARSWTRYRELLRQSLGAELSDDEVRELGEVARGLGLEDDVQQHREALAAVGDLERKAADFDDAEAKRAKAVRAVQAFGEEREKAKKEFFERADGLDAELKRAGARVKNAAQARDELRDLRKRFAKVFDIERDARD